MTVFSRTEKPLREVILGDIAAMVDVDVTFGSKRTMPESIVYMLGLASEHAPLEMLGAAIEPSEVEAKVREYREDGIARLEEGEALAAYWRRIPARIRSWERFNMSPFAWTWCRDLLWVQFSHGTITGRMTGPKPNM